MKRMNLDAWRRHAVWAWFLAPLAALGGRLAVIQAETAEATATEAISVSGEEKTPAPGKKWVRLLKDKEGAPIALETAIVRYVKADQVVEGKPADEYEEYVDLVGAVHIADKRYYRDLNRRFKGYDAVLYELVAPEGTVVPRGRGTPNTHPLGMIQNGMKSMLDVEHQLEQIDYTRDNMIHADLSPDEFFKSMEKRDEGFLQMYFKLQGAAMAQQSKPGSAGMSADFDIIAALLSDDRPRQLKIAMAEQFEGMEALMMGLSGAEGSTLITDRNARALEVLKKRLDAGDKELAIFYGAGHLAEMDDQLEQGFDMRPVGVEWVEAWDLR